MEELRKIIRESLEEINSVSTQRKYESEEVETDFNKTLENDDWVSSAKSTVRWELDNSHKSWGIKDFGIHVFSLIVKIEIYRESTQEDEEMILDYTDKIKSGDYTFSIENMPGKGAVLPSDVFIDEDQKIITINFYYP